MPKPLKSGVINLSKSAKQSSLYMLEEITRRDHELKIDYSKLISFIVNDYRTKYFQSNLKRIITAHKDSRKKIKNKLSSLSESQLQALFKALNKIEQNESSNVS